MIHKYEITEYDHGDFTFHFVLKLIQEAAIFETAYRGFKEHGLLNLQADFDEDKAREIVIYTLALAQTTIESNFSDAKDFIVQIEDIVSDPASLKEEANNIAESLQAMNQGKLFYKPIKEDID